MTRSLCLPQTAESDARLRRILRKYEFADFIFLLLYANRRRDPTYIPRNKMLELRLFLNLNEKTFTKRLARWSDDEVDLVQRGEDGGLFITYTYDWQREQDEDDDDASPAGYGLNGNGLNGNGLNGHAPRQPRRKYSMEPDAVRKREQRARDEQQAGAATPNPPGHFEPNVPQSGQNVPAIERECPTVPRGMSHEMSHEMSGEMSQNVPDISRVRVRNVSNVSRELKDSYDSGDVLTLPPDKNVPPNVPAPTGYQNGHSAAPSSQNDHSAPLPPGPAPAATPRLKTRSADIALVMRETASAPQYRGLWFGIWNWCFHNGKMDCWDEAVAEFIEALRTRPPSGPGSITKKFGWLRRAILAKLDQAGCAYQPPEKAADPGDDALTAEEEAQIQREIAEARAHLAGDLTPSAPPPSDTDADPGDDDPVYETEEEDDE